MNVLLVGSGGREHALAWKISQSPKLKTLYAAPGSDAISETAAIADLDVKDHSATAAFCKNKNIGLVVIGPEAPLADGLSDALRSAGVCVFGPSQAAARLESSKSFAKAFLNKHAIPTANYSVQTDLTQARRAAISFGLPVVVKADGLASGKGVRICKTKEELNAALKSFLIEGLHGEAGKRVVIEECLCGPEVSLVGLCDGKNFLEFPPSSDHKRLKDGDEGPNTGGMGVVAPAPALDEETARRVRSDIIEPILKGFASEELEYLGALYIGLMLTPEGPKVLEFNVRFGDPETQAILPLMTGDLLELLDATARGNLAGKDLPWKGAALTVVLASEGYPEAPQTGRGLRNIPENDDRLLVFHAGTRKNGGAWESTGGRVLGVTGLGGDIASAREKAYRALNAVKLEGAQYRKDIGAVGQSTLEKSA